MMRFFKRHWILSTVLVLLIGALAAAVWIRSELLHTVRNAYAQWGTADLITNYHKSHGHLPTGWPDLEPEYQSGKIKYLGWAKDFAELQQIVAVDFARLPELQSLAATNSTATNLPKPVHPTKGSGAYQGAEPNHLIFDYFVELSHPASPKPQPTP